MKRPELGFGSLLKRLAGAGLVAAGLLQPSPALAQQVTTEMIGPLSGSFTITIPQGPPQCPASGQQDTITFAGSVHVVATVDAAANTVDYHINFLGVKGTGTLVAKYVANGATDLLDQTIPVGPPQSPGAALISISANLIPSGPCRAGFLSAGALPIVVTISFGTDFTLTTVSARVGLT